MSGGLSSGDTRSASGPKPSELTARRRETSARQGSGRGKVAVLMDDSAFLGTSSDDVQQERRMKLHTQL